MRMVLPSFTQLVLILVFTIVEVIFLTVWFILALPGGFTTAAIVVLFFGLLLEHYIATVSGNVGPSPDPRDYPFDKPTSTTTFTQQGRWYFGDPIPGDGREPLPGQTIDP